MVHRHHEPVGDLADRAHGAAAPRLPAEDPHQDHKGKGRRTTAVQMRRRPQFPRFNDAPLVPPLEKVPGLPPAGRPGLHPEQQDVRHGAQQADHRGGHCFGEGRRHAGHLHEGQRRGGRRRRLELVYTDSPTPTPSPPPSFHTFDFSLVTDACTNSDSHSRTSLSARNAYRGNIN